MRAPENFSLQTISLRLLRRVGFPAVIAAALTILPVSSGLAAEPADIRGPDVTITEEEDRTVMEYHQGGVLRMVRIVPTWGKPYYLVPRDQTAGHEDLQRADALLPSWVIVEF